MRIGKSSKFEAEYDLKQLNQEAFLVFAIEAVHQLDWKLLEFNDNGFSALTPFSISSWSERFDVVVENGVAKIKSACTSHQLIDWGKNKKNVQAFFNKLESCIRELPPEEVQKQWEHYHTNFSENADSNNPRPGGGFDEGASGILGIFKPREGYFVAPILISVNIAVFILMILSGVHLISPDEQSLLSWGANYQPTTLSGESWRLFTSTFLHIGILHLLLNMYALFYIGVLLEPYLGKVRFLAAYLITGIAASVASIWWQDNTVSAGASGAIFGMYGVFLALLMSNLIEKSVKQTMLSSILLFVGYNIVYGLRPGSGIDNAAHIGGLISGLLVGFALVPSLKDASNKNKSYFTIGGLAFILVVSSALALNSIPQDMANYQREMERFAEYEQEALSVFNMPENTPLDRLADAYQTKGIRSWKECLKITENIARYQLPKEILEKNIILPNFRTTD